MAKRDWVDNIISGGCRKTSRKSSAGGWVDRIISGGSSKRGFEDKIISKGSARAKGDFVDKIIYGDGTRHPFTERIVNKPMKMGRIEKIASGESSSDIQQPLSIESGDKAMLPDKLLSFAGKAGAAGVRTVMNLPHYYENYKAKQAASEEARQQATSQHFAGLIAQQTASRQAQEQASLVERHRQELLGATQQSQLYRDTAFRERVSQGQTPPQQQSLMQKIRGAISG